MPKCLAVFPSIFLAIDTSGGGAAVNIPLAYQVNNSSVTADFLMVTPGLFNNAGSKGDYEIDIYEGNVMPAAAAAPLASGSAAYTAAAGNLSVNPVVSVPSGQQAIVPWKRSCVFLILIRSTSTTVPANGSRISLTIQPFNT